MRTHKHALVAALLLVAIAASMLLRWPVGVMAFLALVFVVYTMVVRDSAGEPIRIDWKHSVGPIFLLLAVASFGTMRYAVRRGEPAAPYLSVAAVCGVVSFIGYRREHLGK